MKGIVRVPSRNALLLVVAVGVVAGVGGWSLWRALAVPYAEAAIERATGYRAQLGSLWPGLRTLRAREVVIFGAPPFEKAPLARMQSVDIRLGGPGGFWRPSSVLVRGARITYLRAGELDNVRGQRGSARARGATTVDRTTPSASASSRSAASAAAQRRPAVALREGSFEAFVRPRNGARPLVARGRFSADVTADGRVAADVAQAMVEAPGWGFVWATGVQLFSGGGRRSFSASAARLHAADGQPLHAHLVGGGVMERGDTMLWMRTAPGHEPALAATAEMAGGTVRARMDTTELPLSALAPRLANKGLDLHGARLSGKVSAERTPGGPVALDLHLVLSGLTLSHRRLDRQAWKDLRLSFDGPATVFTEGPRVAIDGARIQALGVPLTVRGFTELGSMPRGNWRVETPEGAPPSCPELLHDLPEPVRETLSGMELAGKLGARVSLAFDASAWEDTTLEVGFDPLCQVRREPDNLLALMLSKPGTGPATSAPGAGLPLDSSHAGFVALADMPPALPGAFLTTEDASFWKHPGFDLENIRRALAHDLEVGDFARGASTITQQLAKNLFLGPERTLGRKLSEVVLTWRLHQRLSKKRILELYLNVIELGPGIRGVKRAAEVYFGKPVQALGPLEAAHLAALTPNPAGFSRRFRDGRVDEGWMRKLYDLLGMMNRSGRLSREDLAAARKSRLVLQRI